ncbi:MAG: DUF1207 domain-containing protein [Elusimicrobia bacterium]|nr:DUF1207 domain-containing protein [Elusimicrobiota bacterium]
MKTRIILSLSLLAFAPPASAAEAFPRTLIFQPLAADPRWPAFSGAMQHYYRRPQSTLLWAATFGESFPFVGSRDGERWQFGLQAAVFTIWDVQTQSEDMINADFLVGFPYSWRRGRWSGMFRLFHISSHLGDEFILSHKSVARVNLSYEALDAKLSYDFDHGLRAYGGAGSMIRKYPPEIKPLFFQLGGEWTGPLFARALLRPIAAADLQKHQQNGWEATGVSARAGVQLQNLMLRTRCLQLLLEYYRGHDPNGQFFQDTVEEVGLGLHAYF